MNSMRVLNIQLLTVRCASNEYTKHMYSCGNTVDSRYIDFAYLK